MLLPMSISLRHRKLVKHYHELSDLHQLTFSCYYRSPCSPTTSGDDVMLRKTNGPQADYGVWHAHFG